jgi:hypothetical protein
VEGWSASEIPEVKQRYLTPLRRFGQGISIQPMIATDFDCLENPRRVFSQIHKKNISKRSQNSNPANIQPFRTLTPQSSHPLRVGGHIKTGNVLPPQSVMAR